MGNGTVIAGLIAPGRGGLDPVGAGVRQALASEDFGGVARQRQTLPRGFASGQLAASRRPVQAAVAGRWRRAARARSTSTPTTAPTSAALTAIRVICQPVMSPVTPLKVGCDPAS